MNSIIWENYIVINIVTKGGQERKWRRGANFFYFAHSNFEFAYAGFSVLGGKKRNEKCSKLNNVHICAYMAIRSSLLDLASQKTWTSEFSIWGEWVSSQEVGASELCGASEFHSKKKVLSHETGEGKFYIRDLGIRIIDKLISRSPSEGSISAAAVIRLRKQISGYRKRSWKESCSGGVETSFMKCTYDELFMWF